MTTENTEVTTAEEVVVKTEKVHRMTIQRLLPAALATITGLPVPPRFAVIGREKGYVDVMLPTNYADDAADFVSKVEQACQSIGVEFQLLGEVNTSKGLHLSFTNDLLQSQFDWGSRGLGAAQRAFIKAQAEAAPVAEVIAPEPIAEAAPAAEIALDTTKARRAKGPARSKGKAKAKR